MRSKWSVRMPTGMKPRMSGRHLIVSPSVQRGGSALPAGPMVASGHMTWRSSALVRTASQALSAEQSNSVETSTFTLSSRDATLLHLDLGGADHVAPFGDLGLL